MSAAGGILQTRVTRLMDERAAVTRLQDDLLAAVESRPEGERDMTEIETQQLTGYRARAQALDTEIGDLADSIEREQLSSNAGREIRARLAGEAPGVSLENGTVRYGRFSTYARDFILARANGPTFDKIRAHVGAEPIEAARERLARTPANTLSDDVEGLIPAQHLAQIFQVIDTGRPIVASALRAELERGRLSYPLVNTSPVVAVQTSEKTEAGNTKLDISMEEAVASTYLGGGDLSWQAINWSTPNALELWFRFCAADYALKTEQDAAQVMQHSGFTNNIGSPIGSSPTFAQLMTAIAAGGGDVYANSGRMADTVYMAPDRYWFALGLTSDADLAFGSSALLNVNGEQRNLNVVVSRGMDSGVIVVGDSDGLLVAESPGAPVELRAVEPAIGGLEVGLIGAFEAVVVDDGAFAMITTAS